MCDFLAEIAERGEFVEDLVLTAKTGLVREEKRRTVEKRESLGR